MNNKNFTFFLLFLVFSQQLFAQNEPSPIGKELNRKGQFFFSWGYNRGQFSTSDIHLWGPGYDFTLYDVKASDRPSNFEFDVYFNPMKLSIPQFNGRVGYYLRDNLCITFGFDHMKYVVRQWETVKMSGTIDSSASASYAGNYSQTNVMIRPTFFDYEHTNGLNYLSLELDWLQPIWYAKRRKLRLNLELGAGIAPIVPRSDVVLFNIQGADVFHLSGYGCHVQTGFRMDLGNHFFFRTIIKGGFINLPDVYTYAADGYQAKQHFWFLQEYGALGYCFNFKKKQ